MRSREVEFQDGSVLTLHNTVTSSTVKSSTKALGIRCTGGIAVFALSSTYYTEVLCSQAFEIGETATVDSSEQVANSLGGTLAAH